VFGALQRMRMDGPNGTVGHAEIEIDGSAIMLADEFPDMGFRSPQSLGGAGVSLHLYVKDVDGCFSRAVAAGAKALQPVKDPILRRPVRDGGGPLRPCLDDFDTQRRPFSRRTPQAGRSLYETARRPLIGTGVLRATA
jgi:hypothetical protein